MMPSVLPWRQRLVARISLRLAFLALVLVLTNPPTSSGADQFEEEQRVEVPGVVTVVERDVLYSKGPSAPIPARSEQKLTFGDALGTLALSRAIVELEGQSPLRMWQWTRLTIITNRSSDLNSPPESLAGSRTSATRRRAAQANLSAARNGPGSGPAQQPDRAAPAIRLSAGSIHMVNRSHDPPILVQTDYGIGTPRGTEFVVTVDDDTRSVRFDMIDGTVELANAFGRTNASKGEMAIASATAAPYRGVLKATNVVQWWLFYPAVLDFAELSMGMRTNASLAASFAAYERGNLPQALTAFPGYPAPASPQEDEEKCYLATLLLHAGAVSQAEALLAKVPAELPAVRALRILIAAVTGNTTLSTSDSLAGANAGARSAGEWLALSYFYQSQRRLDEAIAATRQALARSPHFGFAWARLANLEFSNGHIQQAKVAIESALRLTDSNAQAHALHGFLLASQNRIEAASTAFARAIALDPALANGWLGQGLCKIRQGHLPAGCQDLRTAAELEPDRSLLRSFVAKAFADSGEQRIAFKELAEAERLDDRDPTPWLYSALLKDQFNRPNEAMADLERSAALNDNRAVYRSRTLLDQDQAVRSANLANIYADIGLRDVAEREATRAVNQDYSNPAAHLFLANSYNALRDPRQVNIRYETPWFSEFLLANLLAPVGGGALSQTVSENEYSKLFQRDGFGIANETLYTSRGDWTESVAQFGQVRNFEYALDAFYRSANGPWKNTDLEQLTLAAKAKFQVSPADTLLIQASYYDAHSGDVAQYYSRDEVRSEFRLKETQEPIPLVGWHHQWQPGSETLFLVSPWKAQATITDPGFMAGFGAGDETGLVHSFIPTNNFPLHYKSEFLGWSAELEQIWRLGNHTLIAGGRYQAGDFDSSSALDTAAIADPSQPMLLNQHSSTDLTRYDLYAYDQWQLTPWALLTLGLSYDWLELPVNFTAPPLTSEERSLDMVSPKLGLTLTPWTGATVRGAYTRSMGGVSFDQSYRLEPVQVGGFTQGYRGLLPESIAGLVGGQRMELVGTGFEQRFPTGTYLNLTAEQLKSKADAAAGAFIFDDTSSETAPATLDQSFKFRERSVQAGLHQLAGRNLALGAQFRLSEADLESRLALVEDGAGHARSVLQQLNLHAQFNHESGLFASWESVWTHQSNHLDASWRRGDDYWQHNFWLGYRFFQRHAELALGVLNITGQDYKLYPLNFYLETYRDRTVAISGRFAF